MWKYILKSASNGDSSFWSTGLIFGNLVATQIIIMFKHQTSLICKAFIDNRECAFGRGDAVEQSMKPAKPLVSYSVIWNV